MENVDKTPGHGPNGACWIWVSSASNRKYGRFKKKVATHFSLLLDNRPRPNGLFALHSCDNPPCVNPAHLRWGTSKENTEDCRARDRMNRWMGRRAGPANPKSKLTLEAVKNIRLSRERSSILGARYGVAPDTIKDVRNGRTWKS